MTIDDRRPTPDSATSDEQQSTMSDTSSRDALVERLASLLGFEDGASDVLEHLLSIESETDLMDYMSQLLGQENDTVRAFVKDVCRFHDGETILPIQKDVVNNEAKPPAAKQTNSLSKPVVSKPVAKRKALEGRGGRGNRGKTPPKKGGSKSLQTKAAGTTINSPSKGRAAANNAAVTKSASESLTEKIDKTTSSPKTVAPLEKAPPPPRGKATIVCGCFGTKHKCLTNYLYCGRISCEREGYSYCPFCGFLVQEFKATRLPPTESSTNSSKKMNEAWEHKERLLRFDRDFASRTTILDDQADYFSSKTSSWLTDKEKGDAADEDYQQRKELHERMKQQLDIAF